MGFSRVPVTRAETIEHTFYAGETPTDSAATVAVAVTDANGTAISSGDASSAGTGTGRYTYALPAQSLVRLLTVAWTATINGAAVVETDEIEICGAHLFELAVARASDASLSSTGTYPTSDLVVRRDEVTNEAEHITDRAWCARYARVVMHGNGTTDLLLTHPTPDRSARDIRTLRRIAIAPDLDETFVDLTAAQLASVALRPDGSLRRTDGNVWTEGSSNIIAEYEYGRDAPPVDLVRAMYQRLRYRAHMQRSGVTERAESYTSPDGTTVRPADTGPYLTGMPEVDAVYQRYSARSLGEGDGGAGAGAGGRGAPAGRVLVYRPQRHSLFH